jgi:hypothetical protein
MADKPVGMSLQDTVNALGAAEHPKPVAAAPAETPATQVPYTQPPSTNTQLSQMQNYNKLTGFEKWVYGALPPVEKFVAPVTTPASQLGFILGKTTLGSVIGPWLTKAMSWLDIGAEGVERTLGVLSQYADGGQFKFSDAWNAGSLFYDTLQVPKLVKAADGTHHLEVPSDLPGVSGLIWARQQLAAGKSLTDVKAEYNSSLGALQLRAMGQDMIGHMVLDPIMWIILPALKPVDFIKATAETALAAKYAPEVVDNALKVANTELDVAKVAADASPLADNLVKAAETAADKVGYIQSLSDGIKAGTQQKVLNSFDRFAIWLTGGDPINPTAWGRSKLNLFALRPESIAKQLVETLHESFGMTVISKAEQTIAEGGSADEAFKFITDSAIRLSQGSYIKEAGAVSFSLQGRMVQAAAKGFEINAIQSLAEWTGTAESRGVMEDVASVLGMTTRQALAAVQEDATGVVRDVLAKAGTPEWLPTLEALRASGKLTAENLATHASMFEGDAKYLLDFKASVIHLMTQLDDTAFRNAITIFDIKNSTNLISRWASALKSAETLAFLKINPANSFRITVVNEMTMLSRGVFGFMTPKEIASFWEKVGFSPSRLAQAFGIAGDMENLTGMSEGEKLLQEAVTGGKSGAPEKVKRLIRSIDLGNFDFMKLSKKFEANASRRAYTNFYLKWFNDYAEAPKVGSYLSAEEFSALKKVNPDLPDLLEGAWKAARGNENDFTKIIRGNLRLNAATVISDVEKKTGITVSDYLATEQIKAVMDELPQAMEDKNIASWAKQFKARVDANTDFLYKQQISKWVDETINQAQIEGPKALTQQEFKVMDTVRGAEQASAQYMPELADAAKAAIARGEPDVAKSLYESGLRQNAKVFDNAYQYKKDLFAALKEGSLRYQADAIAAGKKAIVPDVGKIEELSSQVDVEWQKLSELRQTELPKIFESDENYATAIKKFNTKVTAQHLVIAQAEKEASAAIDEEILKGIDDPVLREAITGYRGSIRKIVEDNRVLMDAAANDALAELDPVKRKAIWDAALKKEYENLNQINGPAGLTAQMSAAYDGDKVALAIGTKQPLSTAVRKLPPPVTPGIMSEESIQKGLDLLESDAKKIESGKVSKQWSLAEATKRAGPVAEVKPLGEAKNINVKFEQTMRTPPEPEFDKTFTPPEPGRVVYRAPAEVEVPKTEVLSATPPETTVTEIAKGQIDHNVQPKDQKLGAIFEKIRKGGRENRLTTDEFKYYQEHVASLSLNKMAIDEEKTAAIKAESLAKNAVPGAKQAEVPVLYSEIIHPSRTVIKQDVVAHVVPHFDLPDADIANYNNQIDTILLHRGLFGKQVTDCTFDEFMKISEGSPLAQQLVKDIADKSAWDEALKAVPDVNPDEVAQKLLDSGVHNAAIRPPNPETDPKFIPELSAQPYDARLKGPLSLAGGNVWNASGDAEDMAFHAKDAANDAMGVNIYITHNHTYDYSGDLYYVRITGTNGGPFEILSNEPFENAVDARDWALDTYSRIPLEANDLSIAPKAIGEGYKPTKTDLNNLEGLWNSIGRNPNVGQYDLNKYDGNLQKLYAEQSQMEKDIAAWENQKEFAPEQKFRPPVENKAVAEGENITRARSLQEKSDRISSINRRITSQLEWRDEARRASVMDIDQLNEAIGKQQDDITALIKEKTELGKSLGVGETYQRTTTDLMTGEPMSVTMRRSEESLMKEIKQKESKAWDVAKKTADAEGRLAKPYYQNPLSPEEKQFKDLYYKFFNLDGHKSLLNEYRDAKIAGKSLGLDEELFTAEYVDNFYKAQEAANPLPYYDYFSTAAREPVKLAAPGRINWQPGEDGYMIGRDSKLPESPLYFSVRQHVSVDPKTLTSEYKYTASIQSMSPDFAPYLMADTFSTREAATLALNDAYSKISANDMMQMERSAHLANAGISEEAMALAGQATNILPDQKMSIDQEGLAKLLRMNHVVPNSDAVLKLSANGVTDDMIARYEEAATKTLPKPTRNISNVKEADNVYKAAGNQLDKAWAKYQSRITKAGASEVDLEVARYQLQTTVAEVKNEYYKSLSDIKVPSPTLTTPKFPTFKSEEQAIAEQSAEHNAIADIYKELVPKRSTTMAVEHGNKYVVDMMTRDELQAAAEDFKIAGGLLPTHPGMGETTLGAAPLSSSELRRKLEGAFADTGIDEDMLAEWVKRRRTEVLVNREAVPPGSRIEKYLQTTAETDPTALLTKYKYDRLMLKIDDPVTKEAIQKLGFTPDEIESYVNGRTPAREIVAQKFPQVAAPVPEAAAAVPEIPKEDRLAAQVRENLQSKIDTLPRSSPKRKLLQDQLDTLGAPVEVPDVTVTPEIAPAEAVSSVAPPPTATMPIPSQIIGEATTTREELATMLDVYKYQVIGKGGENPEMLARLKEAGLTQEQIDNYVREVRVPPGQSFALVPEEKVKPIKLTNQLRDEIRAKTGLTDKQLDGYLVSRSTIPENFDFKKVVTDVKGQTRRVAMSRSEKEDYIFQHALSNAKIKGVTSNEDLIRAIVEDLHPGTTTPTPAHLIYPSGRMPEPTDINARMGQPFTMPRRAIYEAPPDVESVAADAKAGIDKLSSNSIAPPKDTNAEVLQVLDNYKKTLAEGGENLNQRALLKQELHLTEDQMVQLTGEARINLLPPEEVINICEQAGVFYPTENLSDKVAKTLNAIETYSVGNLKFTDINAISTDVLRDVLNKRLELLQNPDMARGQFINGLQTFYGYTPEKAKVIATLQDSMAKSLGMSNSEWYYSHQAGFVRGGQAQYWQDNVYKNAPDILKTSMLKNDMGVFGISKDGRVAAINNADMPDLYALHDPHVISKLGVAKVEDLSAKGAYMQLKDGTYVVMIDIESGDSGAKQIEAVTQSYDSLMKQLGRKGVTGTPVFYRSPTAGLDGTKIMLGVEAEPAKGTIFNQMENAGNLFYNPNYYPKEPMDVNTGNARQMGVYGITEDGKFLADTVANHTILAKNAGYPGEESFIERGNFGFLRTSGRPYISSYNTSNEEARYITENWDTLATAMDKAGLKSDPVFYGSFGMYKYDPFAAESVDNVTRFNQGARVPKAGMDMIHQNGNIAALYRAYKGTDLSSAIHESAHTYVEMLRYMVDQTGDTTLAGRLKTFEDYAGVVNGDWIAHEGYDPHEKIAVAFENYMRTQKAPTPELRGLFAQIKDWMKQIYKQIKGGDIDVALSPEIKKAFDDMVMGKGPEEVMDTSSQFDNTLMRNHIDMPIFQAANEHSLQQSALIDKLAAGATDQMSRPVAALGDLPPSLADKMGAYLDYAKQGMAEARYSADRFGAYGRDASLLNYSRRTNFDAYLANVFPFAFWTTHSMAAWAVHSIDRPAMFETYMRFEKFLNTAGIPESGVPSRVKGKIRIHLPFVPDWMGDQYIDPLKIALPFEHFAQPFQALQQTLTTANGRAKRVIDQELSDGKITQQQHDDSLANQNDATWNTAMSQVKADDESMNFDTWDFATGLTSPHAPIVWAIKIAQGHPEEIGPLTPFSKTIRELANAAGIDWVNSPLNVEGVIRKKLGLPAFDQWDDYRVDRMLSDMAATGQISSDDALRSMIDRTGPIFDLATKQSNVEYTGGPVGALMGLIGLNPTTYPYGEEYLRGLQTTFFDASTKYQAATEKIQAYSAAHPNATNDEMAAWGVQHPDVMKDKMALDTFFKQHPEYETRLAIFAKPADRLRTFMLDNLWTTWMNLPTMTKDSLKDQLGADFQDMFLNKDSRNTDAIPVERMGVWLKLMGGNPPGTMKLDPTAPQMVSTPPPDIAARAQSFYDYRTAYFPTYYDEQDEYFKLTAGKPRSAYLSAHPDLKAYWDWRRDYLYRNPDVATYLVDTKTGATLPTYPSAGAYEQAKAAQPNLTWQEWQTVLSPSLQQTLVDHFQSGDALPLAAQQYLDVLATQYNITGGGQALLQLIEKSAQ